MTRPLHVLIAGGGLSGLCLAQGLTRAGISCAVYERDPEVRRQGYRITINGDGGNALQQCLPEDLYELYLQASRNTPPRRMAVVVDSQANELSTAPHFGAPNEGERPHTAIHRRTLRQILGARLGDTLQPAAKVVGFQRDDDKVRLELDDGSEHEGDVLVGADGVYSAIRAQRLPDVEVIDTGVRGLGVFARTPLPPDVHDKLPEILLSGFVIAVDPATGVTLAMGAMDPREPPDEAAKNVADVELTPVAPYMMLTGGIRPGTPIPAPQEWTQDTPTHVHAHMCEAVNTWHPALKGLVERIELDTMFASNFMRLDPTPPWEPSNVTLVGDAIHAMLPTLGMGGNTSLRDAAVLTEKLAAAQRGALGLVDAIGAYEADMRAFAYPIMEMSADHDRFGGGGLRQPAERS